MSGFAALGVAPHIVAALDGLGITSPFPIQSSTIPVALGGADIIGQAKTGTGKTLAFGVPVLQRLEEAAEAPAAPASAPAAAAAPKSGGSGRRRGRSSGANPGTKLPPAGGTPQALIVVPTRELAVQVCADLAGAGSTRGVRVQALYGGRAYEPQVKALSEGIDVAVATPGRLLDLVNQGHLVLGRVRTLVLDEADEMLDLGFLPDVERIIRQLPADRQTMLFSATMPGAVISLARQYMNRPTHIRAADPHDEGVSVANIKQYVYRAHDLDKIEMLARILQARGRGLTMVFARTKRAVARITEELQDRHFAVGAVHGDLAQGAREQALRAFRNGKVDVLVATDVAARGIDVEGVTHVVNYQCPEDEKVYTHRIGRTGRAGRTGTSVTLVDWEDMPRWGLINKALGLDYAEPVELYSTSAQLYADLDIPEGSKGALPKQDRVRAGLDAEELEDLGETGRRGRGKAEPEPEPRRERTPRQRRRTRGGRGGATSAEQAATMGAAPVEELFRPAEPTAAASAPSTAGAASVDGEKPARKRTRKRVTAAPVEAAPVAEAPVLEPEQQPAATADAEKPARKRTRKRVTAEPADAVAVEAAPVVETVTPVAEEKAAEPVARKRTRKRAAAPVAEAVVEAPVAEAPVAGTPVAEAPVAEEKPARKRAPRKTAAKKTTAKPETADAGRNGGAIRLAPGSLADPLPATAEPARATEPARAATESAEPAQAVFTQEPILPAAQRSAERAPRKRTAKKAVAAQGPSSAPVSSKVAEAPAEKKSPAKKRPAKKQAQATQKQTQTAEKPAEDASGDALHTGPVANRRRTQV